ncbi:MAG: hypothetical protein HGA45_00830, partial [Chloroflexales bacterium]|nr:hypothetical protein [Chloroflexales bacterium]
VGSGWTLFNNKGKPVRQFEPFFSDTHRLDSDARIGVSPWALYDPLGRAVATVHPDHSWEKVVFDPWRQASYDRNDTVLNADGSTDPAQDPDVGSLIARLPEAQYLPTWHEARTALAASNPERVAAEQAAVHRQTPTVAHFDALGRPFLTIVQNRFERDGAIVEEAYLTRVDLDIEGNQRAVRDVVEQGGAPVERLVMRYAYDMLGSRIRQASMEAGERWTLNDVAGNPIRAWDSRGFARRITYDALRRTTGLLVTESGVERLAERLVYGEGHGAAANHRGRVFQVFDGAGIVTSEAYDFKGNLLRSRRDLLRDYDQAANWALELPTSDEPFTSSTSYDALNRPSMLTTPDSSVYRPGFNQAGLLEQVAVSLRGGPSAPFVSNIDYDAKGQRRLIVYANGARTSYEYEPRTFRLARLRTTRPADPDATASLLFQSLGVVQDLGYTYDAVGNLTRIADAALRTIVHNGQNVEPACAYSYDARYQLIEASGREHIGQAGHDSAPASGNRRDFDFVGLAHPNDTQAMRRYSERYAYDDAGNLRLVRHSASGGSWTRSYEYTAASLLDPATQSNRLTRTTVGNGAARSETYSYSDAQGVDANGCMTAINAMALVWDFKEQLQRAELGGGGTAFYVYDANGQRVRKVIETAGGARSEERIYLGGFEIYRRFGANALTRETLHVMDDQQRIALVETETAPALGAPLVRFQLGNHLGSASLELDAGGALISYEEYHPFGTSSFQAGRSAAEVSLKRYRYTGKERDEETGFAYHEARYCAPWLGRWTSADPGGLADGPNLYRYARNNPIRLNDPSGMDPPDDAPLTVTPLLTQVDLTGVSANLQFRNLLSSDRSVSGTGVVGVHARSSFALGIPPLRFTTTGIGDLSTTLGVDTQAGRAAATVEGGVVLGDPTGLHLAATGSGSLSIPVPERLVLRGLPGSLLLPAVSRGEGDVHLSGFLSAGRISLVSFTADAALAGGRFSGSLDATTIANVGRLHLDVAGNVSAEGATSLQSANLSASVNVPFVGLDARATGAGNADGSLSIRGSADLRLFYLPSLHIDVAGTASTTEANFAGTFRGPGPLFTSYITGDFRLGTRSGIAANAGVFGLTYSPSVSVTDPAPPSPGLRAVAGEPRTPWTPGGLTVGASFFQYSQGNFNYISGGFMPDLSSNFVSNPRFGVTAQWHF